MFYHSFLFLFFINAFSNLQTSLLIHEKRKTYLRCFVFRYLLTYNTVITYLQEREKLLIGTL